MLRRPLSLVLSSDSYHVSLALTHEIRHALHYGKSMERFFEEVDGRLKAARQADSDSYRGFFDLLVPELESARKCERELNQRHAHRFNALDYLRTDELGLSRIIADLLDPHAYTAHGQGPLFLRTFLTKLDIGLTLSDSDLEQAGVSREHKTADGRYIDIYVEIPRGDGTFRLGIENKPYASDSKNQLKDYLDYLQNESKPGDDFRLIYLPPAGKDPSEHSLPRKELESLHGQFTIMLYHGQRNSEDADDRDQAADIFREYRAPCSLTDWLAACREKCQVDRLRWFIGETESFCKRKLGGQTMTTSSETEALEKYMHSNPEQLRTAQVIFDSWLGIKKRICERFMNHLCEGIKNELRDKKLLSTAEAEYIHSDSKYVSDKAQKCNLWFYRKSWKEFENPECDNEPKTTTIWLQNRDQGLKDWIYGVALPLKIDEDSSDSDKDKCNKLDDKLQKLMDRKGKKMNYWPCYFEVQKSCRSMDDWNMILPDLHRECEENGGPITKYYVDTLVELAIQAIPIIDEIENEAE